MTRMTTTGPGYHRASAAVMFGGVTALTLGFALSTAATASADQTVQNTYAVKGSETVNVAVRCPDNMYLVMSDYSSSARLVPYGVEVIESGTAVGVTMTGVDQQQGSGSYRGATGTATNWSVWPQDIVIKAHCTDRKQVPVG
ncbi:hypothetical protein BST26_04405 [Mycolicibacterium insubricum]|jgi:hypothetical protein|uniref:Uncharacterized protein n=2 Tax=Mycolicibacterium insubricum TaxID=444597 RepID=A0A1X0DKB0_9MYCO|nr:hypothetical protein BST26_04405 [Mycolicibacterium insubricum]